MSGGHSTYVPKTGIGRWFDARLPVSRLVHDQFIGYPVLRNLNYAYSFGGILSMMLAAQIVTGVVLAMHYAADTTLAFNSVDIPAMQVSTLYYFAFFLVVMPLLDVIETPPAAELDIRGDPGEKAGISLPACRAPRRDC